MPEEIKGMCPKCGSIKLTFNLPKQPTEEDLAKCDECGWIGKESELVTHGFAHRGMVHTPVPGLFTKTTEMGAGLMGPPLGPQSPSEDWHYPKTLGEVLERYPISHQKGEKLCLSGFGDDIDGIYEIIDALPLKVYEGRRVQLNLKPVEKTQWKGKSKVEILPGTVPAQGGPHSPPVHADEVDLKPHEKELKEIAEKLGGGWRVEGGFMPVVVLTIVEARELVKRMEDFDA